MLVLLLANNHKYDKRYKTLYVGRKCIGDWSRNAVKKKET